MYVCVRARMALWVVMCSSEKARRFGRTYRLHLHGRRVNQARGLLASYFSLVSCLAYSSALKMESLYSSKTSTFLRATRRYNPKDRTVQNRGRFKNLKFY
jgi:hypothetical protein